MPLIATNISLPSSPQHFIMANTQACQQSTLFLESSTYVLLGYIKHMPHESLQFKGAFITGKVCFLDQMSVRQVPAISDSGFLWPSCR